MLCSHEASVKFRLLSTAVKIHKGLSFNSIVVVKNHSTLLHAVNVLNACTLVGFDTESTPLKTKGQAQTGPHLVQLATIDTAFLFPIKQTPQMNSFDMAIHTFLKEIMQSDKIRKIGFGLGSDKSDFLRKFSTDKQCCGFIIRFKRRRQ